MDYDVNKTAHYDSLKDRVVIITGGGQGIGRGFAHHFAAQGSVPVVADINGENAEAVAAEITDSGGRALGLSGGNQPCRRGPRRQSDLRPWQLHLPDRR